MVAQKRDKPPAKAQQPGPAKRHAAGSTSGSVKKFFELFPARSVASADDETTDVPSSTTGESTAMGSATPTAPSLPAPRCDAEPELHEVCGASLEATEPAAAAAPAASASGTEPSANGDERSASGTEPSTNGDERPASGAEPAASGDVDPLAQYCASIGRGNFARLTEENIAKLEEEFRTQTEDLSKQVETRCKGADFLSEADRKKLACYEDAIAADYVDPRSSMGVLFRSALKANAEEAKKYAALKRQEASDFRVQWVKQEYTKFKEERVFKKSWRRIDATKGKYMSVSQLVADDGGWSDPEAVLGTQRLIEKAVAMGDPWIRIHPQTGRTLFLKLTYEFSELFEESWCTFRRELTAGSVVPEGQQQGEGKQAQVEEHTEKGDNTVKDKTGDKKVKGKHGENKVKGKNKDPERDEQWKNALLCRKVILGTMATVSELDLSISSAPAWSWAANEQNQGHLKKLSIAVRSSMTDFHQAFLAEEPQTLRKRHAPDVISVELASFIGLKPKVQQLTEFARTLQRRHLS